MKYNQGYNNKDSTPQWHVFIVNFEHILHLSHRVSIDHFSLIKIVMATEGPAILLQKNNEIGRSYK